MIGQPIRVLLVEDHELVRAGFTSLVQSLPGMEVVGGAANGRQAMAMIRELMPDVVLMDITMPELNGLNAVGQIAAEFPLVRVIMLSMHDNEEYFRQALQAGAAGYLVKDADPAELEMAIRSVARGGSYLSPAVSRHVVSRVRPWTHRGTDRVRSPDATPDRDRPAHRRGAHECRDRPDPGRVLEDGRNPPVPAHGPAPDPRRHRDRALRGPDGPRLFRQVGSSLRVWARPDEDPTLVRVCRTRPFRHSRAAEAQVSPPASTRSSRSRSRNRTWRSTGGGPCSAAGSPSRSPRSGRRACPGSRPRSAARRCRRPLSHSRGCLVEHRAGVGESGRQVVVVAPEHRDRVTDRLPIGCGLLVLVDLEHRHRGQRGRIHPGAQADGDPEVVRPTGLLDRGLGPGRRWGLGRDGTRGGYRGRGCDRGRGRERGPGHRCGTADRDPGQEPAVGRCRGQGVLIPVRRHRSRRWFDHHGTPICRAWLAAATLNSWSGLTRQ